MVIGGYRCVWGDLRTSNEILGRGGGGHYHQDRKRGYGKGGAVSSRSFELNDLLI